MKHKFQIILAVLLTAFFLTSSEANIRPVFTEGEWILYEITDRMTDEKSHVAITTSEGRELWVAYMEGELRLMVVHKRSLMGNIDREIAVTYRVDRGNPVGPAMWRVPRPGYDSAVVTGVRAEHMLRQMLQGENIVVRVHDERTNISVTTSYSLRGMDNVLGRMLELRHGR